MTQKMLSPKHDRGHILYVYVMHTHAHNVYDCPNDWAAENCREWYVVKVEQAVSMMPNRAIPLLRII